MECGNAEESACRPGKNRRENGSWDPQQDEWGSRSGRLYQTCMNTYMLEVYYRHLPLYTKVFETKE